MLLIDAVYINSDGGRVLLNYLISSLEVTKKEVFYLLDERLMNSHPEIKNNRIKYLKGNLLLRHRFYVENKNNFDKVFCFGNLPPSIKLKAPVYTYFHNKLLIKRSKELTLNERIKFKLKSIIFLCLIKKTDYIIVQTQEMKRAFNSTHQTFLTNKILILPFYDTIKSTYIDSKTKDLFLYVSSGVSYKNHYRLIEGFQLFYDEYKIGQLHLTITEDFKELYLFIDKMIKAGYPINNHKKLNRKSLSELYGKASFLIYPSFEESFGLGLVEAIENNCKVIGADLPYTFDICCPSLTINPDDIESIRKSFIKATSTNIKDTKQVLFNQIDELIEILS